MRRPPRQWGILAPYFLMTKRLRHLNSSGECAPGWNRTNDPQLRRLMLYPTELREQAEGLGFEPSCPSLDATLAVWCES